MTGLPAADLKAMRSEAERLLMPTAVTVFRLTGTQSGYGGRTLAPVKVTSTACRIVPPSQQIQAGPQAVRRYGFILPGGTDVKLDDRLSVAGVNYRVIEEVVSGDWEMVRRVTAVKE